MRHCNHVPRPLGSTTAAACLVALLAAATFAQGQEPNAHYLYGANLPPGAVALSQLQRGGPLSGYFQPVELYCPEGGEISLEMQGHFVDAADAGAPRVRAGMLIGPVYRAKVTNIPEHPGAEVYPTIEVVNRLFPPPGEAAKFPIPIHITQNELEMAMEGHFVTRVVYLENPATALPVREDPKFQRYFEVHPRQDALQVADELGRPMAILRMGSRVPDRNGQMGMDYGSPPLIRFPLPAEPAEEVDQPAPAEVKGVVPAQYGAPLGDQQRPPNSTSAEQTSVLVKPLLERPQPYSADSDQWRRAAARNVLRFPNGIFRRRDQ
ncbi:MAG: hypothetical protein RIC55_07105 [Pirellulaceae bacterium]